MMFMLYVHAVPLIDKISSLSPVEQNNYDVTKIHLEFQHFTLLSLKDFKACRKFES